MYTVHSGAKTDGVVEYILTSAYDISTATLNTSKVVHRGGGNGSHVPTQAVFNNDGTKMFIVNHDGVRTIDYWSQALHLILAQQLHLRVDIIFLPKK